MYLFNKGVYVLNRHLFICLFNFIYLFNLTEKWTGFNFNNGLNIY